MKKFVSSMVVMFFAAGLSVCAAAEAPAGQPPGKELTVDQLKAKITADIDSRIKMLQTDRGCVSAARTKEDLKKCARMSAEKRKQQKEKKK